MVWAQARDRVIGVDGEIPWRLGEDQRRFKALTAGAVVVMGRSTWESLPDRARPLPGRDNVVLSRRAGWSAPGARVVAGLDEALADLSGDAWIIGGQAVYAAGMASADVLEVTEVDLEVPLAGARTVSRAPAVPAAWRTGAREPERGWLTSASGLRYRFTTLRR